MVHLCVDSVQLHVVESLDCVVSILGDYTLSLLQVPGFIETSHHVVQIPHNYLFLVSGCHQSTRFPSSSNCLPWSSNPETGVMAGNLERKQETRRAQGFGLMAEKLTVCDLVPDHPPNGSVVHVLRPVTREEDSLEDASRELNGVLKR